MRADRWKYSLILFFLMKQPTGYTKLNYVALQDEKEQIGFRSEISYLNQTFVFHKVLIMSNHQVPIFLNEVSPNSQGQNATLKARATLNRVNLFTVRKDVGKSIIHQEPDQGNTLHCLPNLFKVTMVKCLVQGQKCPDCDSNPQSAADSTRSWVR